MYRRAIISDIHGNLPALEAVLADIAGQQVDEIVCLGDVCGYGPQPKECIDRIRDAAAWTLLGNHDEAIFNEPIGFSSNATEAIHWQRKLLDPKFGAPGTPDVLSRLDWLKGLSPSRKDGAILYVHAAPRDPLHEYVLQDDYDVGCGGPTADAVANFALVDWLCFCGHSHRPGVVADDFCWSTPEELKDNRYVLRPGFKTIVNVGSVGQPRDKHPEACYVIFDAQAAAQPEVQKVESTKASAPAPNLSKADDNTLVLPRKTERIQSGTRIIEGSDKAVQPAHEFRDDETRADNDPVLQQARNTALLRAPRILFRRVPYDVAEATARVFAVPELPKYNGIRLAKGI